MEHGPHRYEAPFCPSTQQGEPCVCIVCGHYELATKQVSSYPMSYVPPGWSTSSRDKGLRCDTCTQDQKVHPEFALNNEVWMTVKSPDQYSNNQGRSETYSITKVSRQFMRVEVQNAARQPTYTEVAELTAALQPQQEERRMEEEPEEEEIEEQPDRRPRRNGRRLRGRRTRSRLRHQAAEIGSAVALGGKLALANEAGDIMVDIAKEVAKDMPMVAMALEHPDGREIAKMLVALSVHSATVHTSLVPQAEFVGEAAKLQMSASSMALLQPRLKALRKHFLKLAEVGEQMSSLQARVESDEEAEEREAAEAEVEEELADMKADVATKSKPNGRSKKKAPRKRT